MSKPTNVDVFTKKVIISNKGNDNGEFKQRLKMEGQTAKIEQMMQDEAEEEMRNCQD